MAEQGKRRWMRLDNAAKIYPAARRQNWSNIFRLSATLTEDVDTEVLQSALAVTAERFPSIAARLRKGVFWYYLEQIDQVPPIRAENSYPLTRMGRKEMRKCAFRVVVYGRRIALEVFHALTDGNGALVFLKTLLAEYLQQKYGICVPSEQGVLDRCQEPAEWEMEDSFLKYAGPVQQSRGSRDAFRLTGTPEKDGYLNLTCFRLPVEQVLAKAREQGVSVTSYLCAALMIALQELQEQWQPDIKKRKNIKVLIPVNLRSLFPSRTLRNFMLYTIPELEVKMGRYSFREACRVVHHHMGLDVTAKRMSQMIATNVASERSLAVRLMPLFIKNLVMKAVFSAVGERKSCLSFSNLGVVKLPDVMLTYIKRMDFILGAQATAPHNCGVLSFGDSLYINFIRSVREPELEYQFYRVLRELGLSAQVQSNGG